MKLGHTARIGNGSTPRRDSTIYWDDGDIPWLNSSVVNESRVTQAEQFVTAAALRECHLPVVAPGSVLVGLTGQGKTRGMATILEIEATINQHIAYVTPDRSRWLPGYLLWSLRAVYDELRYLSEENGSTKGGLTCEALKQFRLTLPPVKYQRAICDYLDRETARIDTLIEEQQRLIEVLRERRVSAIAAEFAETATTPLRQVIEYAQTGPFGTQLTADEYVDNGVPVINPTHIQRGRIVPDDSITVTPEKAEDLARYRLAAGDIVLGRKGEVDKSALVDGQSAGYVCGSDAMALRPAAGTVPDYLWWFLQSAEAHSQLEFWSVGATVSGLNQTTIRKVRLPLPGEQEQRRIARYLYEKTAKIDALIGETLQFIGLSQERRSALITAAVTGQIDVRETA
ncbi:restriction endonuclease subunit S (plasmid) [Rhodococcus sp. M8-35]